MFCTSCGTTLPADAKLCSQCGKPTGAAPASTPASTPYQAPQRQPGSGLISSFLSTDSRLTPAVMKIIYLLGLILIGANTVVGMMSSISTMAGVSVMGIRVTNVGDGFIELLNVFVVAAISIVVLRVFCEVVILLNSIKENTKK